MDFARFKAVCPYLGRTKSSTLRSLSTNASARYPSISRLAAKATGCPVMGPALSTTSTQIVKGYASVAGTTSGASPSDPEVVRLHQQQGVSMAGGDVTKCPHASAAREAARVAEQLATAARKKATAAAHKKEAAQCPFHAQAQKVAKPAAEPEVCTAKNKVGFDYEKFYNTELDKKHNDSSYRYFNNINRLAAKFPVAHTGEIGDEVEVWCANDYLGMGNNPVVIETMQCVTFPSADSHIY